MRWKADDARMDSLELLRKRAAVAGDAQISGLNHLGVCQALEQELGKEAADAVRAAKLPKRLVALFKYPATAFLDLVDATVSALVSQGWEEQAALRRMGQGSLQGFTDTPVGKTFVYLASGNPHRGLAAAPVAYRTARGFGEYLYERVSDTHGRLSYASTFTGPTIEEGVIAHGMRVIASTNVFVLKTTIRDELQTSFVIDVTW